MGQISTKWRWPIGLAASALSLGLARADCLRDPHYDGVILAALDSVFHMQYAAAESLLDARIPERDPARPYFAGLACLDRFADLGDTAALERAESDWKLLASGGSETSWQSDTATLFVYRGLAALQLSYISNLRGDRLSAARQAFSAQNRLAGETQFAEARAALALFDYYRARFWEHLNFLPFVNSRSQIPLGHLETATDSSRYLKDVLSASAFWIHFDRGEYAAALDGIAGFLERYPHNRMARQMRADAWFREGRLQEADTEYSTLLREYAALRDSLPKNYLPLGYYCAAGNLARINEGLGMRAQAEQRWREWQHADSIGLGPWLPASLKQALANKPSP